MRIPDAADRHHVDDVSEILYIGADEVVFVRRWRHDAPVREGFAALPPRRPISSLARVSIQRVTSVSAGPPLGELYLKPPLSGGLCEGVMTMPSARPRCRRGCDVRIACDTAGVGVYSPAAWRSLFQPRCRRVPPCGLERRLRQRVRIDADEQRTAIRSACGIRRSLGVIARTCASLKCGRTKIRDVLRCRMRRAARALRDQGANQRRRRSASTNRPAGTSVPACRRAD